MLLSSAAFNTLQSKQTMQPKPWCE